MQKNLSFFFFFLFIREIFKEKGGAGCLSLSPHHCCCWTTTTTTTKSRFSGLRSFAFVGMNKSSVVGCWGKWKTNLTSSVKKWPILWRLYERKCTCIYDWVIILRAQNVYKIGHWSGYYLKILQQIFSQKLSKYLATFWTIVKNGIFISESDVGRKLGLSWKDVIDNCKKKLANIPITQRYTATYLPTLQPVGPEKIAICL